MITTWPIAILIITCLLVLSAFFSGSETALMSANRYKIAHQAKKGDTKAKRLESMVSRPQDLLSVILIGNTFTNMLLSAVVTTWVSRSMGDQWLLPATIGLTFIVLVCSELLPKTIAAYYADGLSRGISGLFVLLLRLFKPIVVVVNTLVAWVLRFLGLSLDSQSFKRLSREELKGLIESIELSNIKHQDAYQQMLLGVLDLAGLTVNDVMVPRADMQTIDIRASQDRIIELVISQRRHHLIFSNGGYESIIGIAQMSSILELIYHDNLTQASIKSVLKPVHYVPEGTILTDQLRRFQEDKIHLAVVVDEYGVVSGAVNIEDIIEEIIGDFAMNQSIPNGSLKQSKDGRYDMYGSWGIRDVNRALGWQLTESGPNTLSGLVIEYLECIPEGPVAYRAHGYEVEVLSFRGNRVHKLNIKRLDEDVG
ncbi:MAG: CNNM domain-containing protein [Pseudomonadota bacterium]|nr:CNNM domain-containing protein [Pseudomonadota bacterium]